MGIGVDGVNDRHFDCDDRLANFADQAVEVEGLHVVHGKPERNGLCPATCWIST